MFLTPIHYCNPNICKSKNVPINHTQHSVCHAVVLLHLLVLLLQLLLLLLLTCLLLLFSSPHIVITRGVIVFNMFGLKSMCSFYSALVTMIIVVQQINCF
jgi:hypothetical protein